MPNTHLTPEPVGSSAPLLGNHAGAGESSAATNTVRPNKRHVEPGDVKQDGQQVEVRVARSVAEVEGIRDVWTACQWHPNADIDFYLHVLRSEPEILRPHVLVIYIDGSPAGMLVGRLMQTNIETRLGYKTLFKTPAKSLTFVYGGVAGELSPENGRILISEVIRSLRGGEADLATFRFVRTDSPLYRLLAEYPGFFMRDRFPQPQSHWKMLLPRKVDQIYSQLSRDHRSELRRKSKKLMEEFGGNVRVHCFRRPEEIDRMFADVEAVAKKTYHRGLGFGFVDNPEMRARVHLQTQKGWFRAYVLYLADAPAAFWIGDVYGGRFYSGYLGYDDAFGRHSPGMFLLTKMFEDFCAEGVEEIDFGLGDARYKRQFGNCTWEEASLNIFAPTVKGLGINAMRTPITLIDRMVKQTAGKTQILSKIKKLWRNHAMESAN